MEHALKYSAKVWLTTALLAPIIYLLIFESRHGDEQESGFIFLIVLIMMIIGCVGSLPYWLLLASTVNWLTRSQNSSNKMNLLCCSFVVAILSAASITIWHSWSGINLDLVPLAVIYVLVSSGSVWLYKLKPADHSER